MLASGAWSLTFRNDPAPLVDHREEDHLDDLLLSELGRLLPLLQQPPALDGLLQQGAHLGVGAGAPLVVKLQPRQIFKFEF